MHRFASCTHPTVVFGRDSCAARVWHSEVHDGGTNHARSAERPGAPDDVAIPSPITITLISTRWRSCTHEGSRRIHHHARR
ncbi:hypothetical protein DVS28_a3045 [Euzebya pacifica]|uniref:Uncharacterized protein n=1 Tax=Euzebya pacifica TaxID=1608957 RepID=A0A346XZS7_9ACTN|nr:hypothetical protein DVS28_a3045 [Euzebya pacifica]